MTELTAAYECRHLQTYQGLKKSILRLHECGATDTIDLKSATMYKRTFAIVDGQSNEDGCACTYDATVDFSNIKEEDIRMIYGINVTTGAFVEIATSVEDDTDCTLTVGSGPVNQSVDVFILWRTY